MKPARIAAAAGSVFAARIALSFIHPWGDLRSVPVGSTAILAGAAIPPDVRHILETKCADCHSTSTRWPFYSRFAPGSWLMEIDVHKGRAHLNLSDWPKYDAESQVELLVKIGVEARRGEMPVRQNLFLHPEARLADEEKQAIYDWSKAERKRVRDLTANK